MQEQPAREHRLSSWNFSFSYSDEIGVNPVKMSKIGLKDQIGLLFCNVNCFVWNRVKYSIRLYFLAMNEVK